MDMEIKLRWSFRTRPSFSSIWDFLSTEKKVSVYDFLNFWILWFWADLRLLIVFLFEVSA